MAERRMFAKTIIDSDAFLDMPQSSQLLYFHLSMRADDEGFINNPKSIMRNVRCTEEDILQLINKKFIIPFESGIVVIKHWKIHNYIAKDRFKPTKYQDEKSGLALDENNSYTTCIQNVDKLDTQDRLGEDRLDKDSIREVRNRVNYEQIKDLYNDICISFPKITSLSDTRKKSIKARLNTYTVEQFEEMFKKAEASTFLKGGNNRNWTANFDWLMKDSNFAKVLDGNYDNKPQESNKNSRAAYNIDAFEKMVDEKDKPKKNGFDDFMSELASLRE